MWQEKGHSQSPVLTKLHASLRQNRETAIKTKTYLHPFPPSPHTHTRIMTWTKKDEERNTDLRKETSTHGQKREKYVEGDAKSYDKETRGNGGADTIKYERERVVTSRDAEEEVWDGSEDRWETQTY